ncbi:MAG: hypothetical protein AAF560_10485 [Acidobacteriota bacterium]
MRRELLFSTRREEWKLRDLQHPLDLDQLIPGSGPWEVEIGFGKGRYLLEQAQAHPERRYLGFEIVSKYFRLLRHRARVRGVDNLLLMRGEALYALSAVLPRGFARIVHVYFPDPWPKARHHRRRLFDPRTLDLVLGVLQPDGELWFATDFIEYGERVAWILRGHPCLEVHLEPGPWPDGARTNYEAKYMQEGRPILRLKARWREAPGSDRRLHPEGADGILSAVTSCPTAPPA